MSNHYHFIGIGGIGMSGLAHMLLKQHKLVSGSDIAVSAVIESLIKAGATVYKNHSSENITPNMIVVYSSDIKSGNPELESAKQQGCTLLHRSDLLAQMIEHKKSLAVAGTHGKTTTSALLSAVMVEAGTDPSFAVGGILPQYQTNAQYGAGEIFVLEADESDRTFLKYHPFGAIVTNIDRDHLINYEGKTELLIEAFSTFIKQVQSPKHLFWCGDDPLLQNLDPKGQSYGFGEHCQWKITQLWQEGFHVHFNLQGPDKTYDNIELSLIGKHNVLNAAAVFGLSINLGLSESSIRQALKSFQGVLRRCEKKGIVNDILFLDDYAHHPTEIRTTLEGIRQAIGERRLIAVYQPHRYSRIQECLGTFGSCFEHADEVIITDIYGAGETPIPNLSHQQILEEINGVPNPCMYVPRTALSHQLSRLVKSDDVLVTLGAGDVTKVSGETIVLLDHPKKSV